MVSLGYINNIEKYALIDGNHRVCSLSFLSESMLIQLCGTIIYPSFTKEQLIGIASHTLNKTDSISNYSTFDQLQNLNNVLKYNQNINLLKISEKQIQRMKKIISFMDEKSWSLLRDYHLKQKKFTINALYQTSFVQYTLENIFQETRKKEIYNNFLENSIKFDLLCVGGDKLTILSLNIITLHILNILIPISKIQNNNSKLKSYLLKLKSDFKDDPIKPIGLLPINETPKNLHFKISLISLKLYKFFNEKIPEDTLIKRGVDIEKHIILWSELVSKKLPWIIDFDPTSVLLTPTHQLTEAFKEKFKKKKLQETDNNNNNIGDDNCDDIDNKNELQKKKKKKKMNN